MALAIRREFDLMLISCYVVIVCVDFFIVVGVIFNGYVNMVEAIGNNAFSRATTLKRL